MDYVWPMTKITLDSTDGDRKVSSEGMLTPQFSKVNTHTNPLPVYDAYCILLKFEITRIPAWQHVPQLRPDSEKAKYRFDLSVPWMLLVLLHNRIRYWLHVLFITTGSIVTFQCSKSRVPQFHHGLSFHADEEIVCMYKRAQREQDTGYSTSVYHINRRQLQSLSRSRALGCCVSSTLWWSPCLEFNNLTWRHTRSTTYLQRSTTLGIPSRLCKVKTCQSVLLDLIRPDHFQDFFSCSRVTVGGFGGTWHHDATSQLPCKDGTIFEYLSLYYLNDSNSGATGNHNNCTWLECQLQTHEEEPTNMTRTFCPLSTMDGQMLVLRNDFMMHRTPVLCTARRFCTCPFEDWTTRTNLYCWYHPLTSSGRHVIQTNGLSNFVRQSWWDITFA